MKIILVGYMAVGKSTIGSLLSEKLNYKALDLDKIIEKKLNLSIPEIFKTKGELFFRRMEHEIFKEILEEFDDSVISTGGGTPCYANNHLLLNGDKIKSFYLKAPIALIVERLLKEKKHRPIIAAKTDEELNDFVAKHLFERSYFYSKADVTILIEGKTPEDIVSEIAEILN